MQDIKILILHKNNHILEKLSQSLRNSGYSVIVANNVETSFNLALSLKPELILWGDILSARNKEIIQKLKASEFGEEHSIIVMADNIEIFDRIEAEKYGVDDFCSVTSDYSELKSRIHFHINHMRQIRFHKIRSRKYDNLFKINHNIMLCQDIFSLCEVMNEFLLKYYNMNFIISAVYNASSDNFDYFNIITPDKNKRIDIEEVKVHKIWRNYFFKNNVKLDCEQITDRELLNYIHDFNLNYGPIFQFPIYSAGKSLGVLLISLAKEIHIDSEGKQILQTLIQSIALRIQEIRRMNSKNRESGVENIVIRDLFSKLSEDETLAYLSKNLIKIIGAEQCIYMNYNEGFRFLSPKFLYKSDTDENLLDLERPLVLLIKDFPTFEGLLNSRKPLLIESLQNESYQDLKNLPTIKESKFKNIIIFPLWYTNTIQGFFILGNINILKKYTDKEIYECEQFIQNATTILEENHVLKQANHTIKQLDRIFELATDLTLDSPLSNIFKKITTAIRRTLGWNVVILDKKIDYNDHFETINVLGMKEVDYQKYIKENNYPPFKNRLDSCFHINRSYFYDHIRSKLSNHEKATKEFAMCIGTEWNDNDWIYVPIESRGKLLGMISVNDPVDRRRPDKERIKSIEYFANQAAMVMENFALFESLKSSESKYRMLAETMTMGLVTCDFSGKIIYINQSLVNLLKYSSRERLLNKKIYNICESGSVHKLEKKIVTLIKDVNKAKEESNDSDKGIEIDLIAFDGEKIPFMMYVSPYLQENMKLGFLGVLADLRAQKKLENMKADFNSMIVHDLRSPLNIIQGYTDIVRGQLIDRLTIEQEDLLNIAKENVNKVLKLVDNFLISAKLESGQFQVEPEINSINALIESVFEHQKIIAKEKNINLIKDLDQNIPLIYFDRFRIEQVLNNIVNNAIKFSPINGTVSIKNKLKKKKNEIDGRTEMYVEISVSDTGVGIPKEELEKVFNKYQQTEAGKNASLKGTGLGLAICREIIELHKGEIWVESEINKGSTFYFILPIQAVKL
jgi:PAS domain S-box-containing protein